jgi:hypothetical protein
MRSTLSLRIPEKRSMQSQLKSTPLAVISSGTRVRRSAVSLLTLIPKLLFGLNRIKRDYAPLRMGNHDNDGEIAYKGMKNQKVNQAAARRNCGARISDDAS